MGADLPELPEIPDKDNGMIALKQKYLGVVVAAKDRMVRVGDWKLSYQPLVNGALYKLFNIVDDPGCQRDIMARHPEIGARLQAILEEWIGADELVKGATTSPARSGSEPVAVG